MSEFTEDKKITLLYGVDELAARVDMLARDIAARMGRDFLVVPILKGSFIFAADLLRALHRVGAAPRVDFIGLSSYRGDKVSSGAVRIVRDVETEIEGMDVLLVDDILESGRTLAFATALMRERQAKSVQACVLLEKPGKLAADIAADFVGFTCPDRFVVGYGMDLAHAFRELPFIATLEN